MAKEGKYNSVQWKGPEYNLLEKKDSLKYEYVLILLYGLPVQLRSMLFCGPLIYNTIFGAEIIFISIKCKINIIQL
jgi:hypothetical protein